MCVQLALGWWRGCHDRQPLSVAWRNLKGGETCQRVRRGQEADRGRVHRSLSRQEMAAGVEVTGWGSAVWPWAACLTPPHFCAELWKVGGGSPSKGWGEQEGPQQSRGGGRGLTGPQHGQSPKGKGLGVGGRWGRKERGWRRLSSVEGLGLGSRSAVHLVSVWPRPQSWPRPSSVALPSLATPPLSRGPAPTHGPVPPLRPRPHSQPRPSLVAPPSLAAPPLARCPRHRDLRHPGFCGLQVRNPVLPGPLPRRRLGPAPCHLALPVWSFGRRRCAQRGRRSPAMGLRSPGGAWALAGCPVVGPRLSPAGGGRQGPGAWRWVRPGLQPCWAQSPLPPAPSSQGCSQRRQVSSTRKVLPGPGVSARNSRQLPPCLALPSDIRALVTPPASSPCIPSGRGPGKFRPEALVSFPSFLTSWPWASLWLNLETSPKPPRLVLIPAPWPPPFCQSPAGPPWQIPNTYPQGPVPSAPPAPRMATSSSVLQPALLPTSGPLHMLCLGPQVPISSPSCSHGLICLGLDSLRCLP